MKKIKIITNVMNLFEDTVTDSKEPLISNIMETDLKRKRRGKLQSRLDWYRIKFSKQPAKLL